MSGSGSPQDTEAPLCDLFMLLNIEYDSTKTPWDFPRRFLFPYKFATQFLEFWITTATNDDDAHLLGP